MTAGGLPDSTPFHPGYLADHRLFSFASLPIKIKSGFHRPGVLSLKQPLLIQYQRRLGTREGDGIPVERIEAVHVKEDGKIFHTGLLMQNMSSDRGTRR
jgi:hypothetical protein